MQPACWRECDCFRTCVRLAWPSKLRAVFDVVLWAPYEQLNLVNIIRVENRALLGYYATGSGNPLPTFRVNISVPPAKVKKSKSVLDSSTSRRRLEIMPCMNCDELCAYCMQTSCVGNFEGGGGLMLSVRRCKVHHPPYAFSSKYVLVNIICTSAYQ